MSKRCVEFTEFRLAVASTRVPVAGSAAKSVKAVLRVVGSESESFPDAELIAVDEGLRLAIARLVVGMTWPLSHTQLSIDDMCEIFSNGLAYYLSPSAWDEVVEQLQRCGGVVLSDTIIV